MRLFLACLLALLALPATAQPPPQAFMIHVPVAKLECRFGTALDVPIAQLRAMPQIQEAPEDLRDFCAFIGRAAEGPWRRYAILQMEESPYWCGSAGCQVLVFIEDQQGNWRYALHPDIDNNAFALEEGVHIDMASPRGGLPVLGLPQRRTPQIGYYSWIFDEKAGVFIDPLQPD